MVADEADNAFLAAALSRKFNMTYNEGSLFKVIVKNSLGMFFKLTRSFVPKTQFIVIGYYAPAMY